MTELLCPAGDFETAKVALFNGADAIYCAAERFGARAYAKNLTMDELERILILAHTIGKKIYVTVNTIVKEDELKDCLAFVDELYKIGVDAIICADFAVITHIINDLPGMEAHISTQCGVKSLEDVRFFEELGAKRCVLARENTIEEIKNIKANSDMPLEVFAHGALCVSYSGGCLLSSITTLRSGNRGRCAQNCRREYKIYKNGNLFADTGFHLSMKDLNTSSHLVEFLECGVDSLKLEGRMKNPEYVKVITSEYRKAIDNKNYKPDMLNHIFHRAYTKGFVFGEDRGNIVDYTKRSNEGQFIGKIVCYGKEATKISLSESLNVGDRIRIALKDSTDYYFNIDTLQDKNHKDVENTSGIAYIHIFKEMPKDAEIYKMVDSTIDLTLTNEFKLPITFTVTGCIGKPLVLSCKISGKTYNAQTEMLLEKALKAPLSNETLFKQLSKLNETSMYLKDINNLIKDDVFITVSSLNEVRRHLVSLIEDDMQGKRLIPTYHFSTTPIDYELEDNKLCVFCVTEAQFKACKDIGINTIYYNNYVPYVDAKYEDIDESYILAGNYGALFRYKDKEIISDYSFNVINSMAIYNLHKCGVKYVTLSAEASKNTISSIYKSYVNTYKSDPNLEIMVYGRTNLMTIKYCPLRRFGECGKCKDQYYELLDNKARFPLYHVGCIGHIVNEKPLNLIDELNEISNFTKRFRINLTVESYEESVKILKMFKSKLNNLNIPTKNFNSETNTRGYYKREIL